MYVIISTVSLWTESSGKETSLIFIELFAFIHSNETYPGLHQRLFLLRIFFHPLFNYFTNGGLKWRCILPCQILAAPFTFLLLPSSFQYRGVKIITVLLSHMQPTIIYDLWRHNFHMRARDVIKTLREYRLALVIFSRLFVYYAEKIILLYQTHV